jgi:hypothetical protein
MNLSLISMSRALLGRKMTPGTFNPLPGLSTVKPPSMVDVGYTKELKLLYLQPY